MAVAPIINGQMYAWANVQVVINGTPLTTVTAVNYKASQKKENVYGSGIDPQGRAYGNKEYESSIEVSKTELDRFVSGTPTGDLLDVLPFDIAVQWKTSDGKFTEDKLLACEFTELDTSVSQGDMAVKIKVPLIIAKVVRTV